MLSIDLSGRVILVLGGSRGIGEGIVRLAARAGGDVVFTHTGRPGNEERVRALTEEIGAAGGRAEAVALDALDGAGTTALAARVAAGRGRLDGLVCNVGRNQASAAEQLPDAEWARFLELNLTSAFYGVRAVLPHMLAAGRGRIVLVGSSAVYDGGGGSIDYAAAKAGLRGMMAYLCRAYARRGILTNIVHPAVIETELLRVRYATPEARRQLIAQVPAGRLGTPEDIGGLVAYLLSPWGDYLCGQEILADGGRTRFGK